ncbi:MAG: hypothetical protein WA902_10250, partial [Thermosynechococcaceae cyanobacterium]
TQTKDVNWQQSPSLLVIEFIMDYRVWNDSAVQRIHHDNDSAEIAKQIQADWQQLIDKFCRPDFMAQPASCQPVSLHDITREDVVSAETVDGQALIQTRIHSGVEHDLQRTEVSFEYELRRDNSRWFLEQVYAIHAEGRLPILAQQ